MHSAPNKSRLNVNENIKTRKQAITETLPDLIYMKFQSIQTILIFIIHNNKYQLAVREITLAPKTQYTGQMNI